MADSPDRKAARPLTTLGGVEPLNAQVKAVFAQFEATKARVNEARSKVERTKTELRALREQLANAVSELYHEVSPSGEFITIKYTTNPRYPKGFYLVSYGERGRRRHVTLIFDPEGNLIDENPKIKTVRDIQHLSGPFKERLKTGPPPSRVIIGHMNRYIFSNVRCLLVPRFYVAH